MDINSLLDEKEKLLLETFFEKFKSVSAFVKTLQIKEKFKDIILKSFDDGFLWTREALMVAAWEEKQQAFLNSQVQSTDISADLSKSEEVISKEGHHHDQSETLP